MKKLSFALFTVLAVCQPLSQAQHFSSLRTESQTGVKRQLQINDNSIVAIDETNKITVTTTLNLFNDKVVRISESKLGQSSVTINTQVANQFEQSSAELTPLLKSISQAKKLSWSADNSVRLAAANICSSIEVEIIEAADDMVTWCGSSTDVVSGILCAKAKGRYIDARARYNKNRCSAN